MKNVIMNSPPAGGNKWINQGFAALISLLVGCSSTPVATTTPVMPQPVAVTLRAAAQFPFGAALNPNLLTSNNAYRQVAQQEYSSITAENYLKMENVHPAQDRYDWTGSDVLVAFAEQNKQRMHGHTLVWHQAVPAWVTNFKGDSLAWEALFKTHIQTVIAHYKDRLASFDVVNEAFGDDGTLRPSVWLTHLGPDYVARAFQYAREASPGVKLFYNEYGHEYSPKRLAATVALAADFKKRGIPIDGLGLQMHTNIGQSDAAIQNAIQQVAATGLLVHISELDVRVNQAKQANYVLTDADKLAQRQKFAAIVRAYKTLVPKAQQHGITTWNIGDGDSWIPNFCSCQDFPLPFDKQYARKPAYDGILDGLTK
ncbi:endo-1,4-beta-xylanase [Fibrella aquatilis]|uniref:Beta-xylanase n=1 Tax=Fibrella aquatilis TaxID=2817059 RepID=A0A939K2F9_9BACT|nr:endo-1,4-beta-xylanase [Fibrella aquatilis]MBO0933265.1 endo-1,4-beta-xylanase [Fibrella aquatilis]